MDTITHNWIDAHCHLADSRLLSTLENELEAARSLGIHRWIQGGIDPNDWDRQAELKKRFPGAILTCFGIHPWWVASHSEEEIEKAFQILEERAPECTAMGEFGLDGIEKFIPTLPLQERVFRRGIEMSNRHRKPLVLHIVRKHTRSLALLKEIPPEFGGIVHSFGGSVEEAEQYRKMGFLLSFSGSITRPGNHAQESVIKKIPLESIVVETDAPDQPPYVASGHREKQNPPKNLVVYAKRVGEIKGLSYEIVLDMARENLKRVFKI